MRQTPLPAALALRVMPIFTASGGYPTDMVPSDTAWKWNDLDHDSAAALLLPHLPGTGLTPLEPLGQGDFCLAFALGSSVVRVARHAEAAAALGRETCVMANIAPLLPLPVPRLSFTAPSGCPPFTVHEAVAGEALSHEDWEAMPPGAQEETAASLALFLSALHAISTENGVGCILNQHDAAEWAQRLHEASADTIRGLLDSTTQRRLDRTLAQWAQPSAQETAAPVLIHCDIAPGHVLYNPQSGRLTGVIDFGDIALGEPARDFIYIYEDFGPNMLERVLHAYNQASPPVTMYAIRKWYLLEAIAWTIDRYAEKECEDTKHGLNEITIELALISSSIA
jgi:aminoglycoside 2''-phosphotransferase